jgi:hypothetical protein
VLTDVAAGDVVVGKPRDWPSFGWDNEYGERKIHVRQFQASKFLVTNAEFHEFVKSGGYAAERFWTRDGWQWRSYRNSKWPTFWVKDGPEGLHKYKLRLCFDVVAMAWDLPVDVNYHEGKAFCAWKSERYETRTFSDPVLCNKTRRTLRVAYGDNHRAGQLAKIGLPRPCVIKEYSAASASWDGGRSQAEKGIGSIRTKYANPRESYLVVSYYLLIFLSSYLIFLSSYLLIFLSNLLIFLSFDLLIF